MTASNLTYAAHDSHTTASAGTTLASLSGLAAGRYAVTVWAYYAGTLSTSTDADNIALFVDGSSYAVLSLAGVAAAGPAAPFTFTVATTTGAIACKAVATATTGAVYKTSLTAQMVNAAEYL